MRAISRPQPWHLAIALWLLCSVGLAYLAVAHAVGKRAYDLAFEFFNASNSPIYMRPDVTFPWGHLADLLEHDRGQLELFAMLEQEWHWMKYYEIALLLACMLFARHIQFRLASYGDRSIKRNIRMLAAAAKAIAAICILYTLSVVVAFISALYYHGLHLLEYPLLFVEWLVGLAILVWLAPKQWVLGTHNEQQLSRQLSHGQPYAGSGTFVSSVISLIKHPANIMAVISYLGGLLRKYAKHYIIVMLAACVFVMIPLLGMSFNYLASGTTLGFIEPGSIRASPNASSLVDYVYVMLYASWPATGFLFLGANLVAYFSIRDMRMKQHNRETSIRPRIRKYLHSFGRRICFAAFLIMLLFELYGASLAFAFNFTLPYISITLFAAMCYACWHALEWLAANFSHRQLIE